MRRISLGLITGGSRGIGPAVAQLATDRGYILEQISHRHAAALSLG
ncbi:MAG TPA: hypothetical protein VE420_10830 [Gemmatimonadales bacterium]|nr:hypothetical protein [Gemmatimonadales bacterium]